MKSDLLRLFLSNTPVIFGKLQQPSGRTDALRVKDYYAAHRDRTVEISDLSSLLPELETP